MTALKVSPEYQIVIPKGVCETMGVRPGQKIRLIRFGDQIRLVPVRPIEEMRGWLKGVNVTIERDDEDRV